MFMQQWELPGENRDGHPKWEQCAGSSVNLRGYVYVYVCVCVCERYLMGILLYVEMPFYPVRSLR